MAFRGAMVKLDSDIVGSGNTIFDWDSAVYDTGWKGLSFWLGPDLAFTAVSGTVTATAHGMITGEGPLQVTTLGTLPAPLGATTNYWIIRVDDDTIQFASSFVNAMNCAPITITSDGASSHTLERASRLCIPGGGITKVRLAGAVGLATSTMSQGTAAFFRDAVSGSFLGSSVNGFFTGFTNVASSAGSPPFLANTSPAYQFQHFSIDAAHDIAAATTSFAIEVVEAA